MAGSRVEHSAPRRLVLDSGAVISLARGEPRTRALLARALELDVPIDVPVVVLAETLRGGRRDAPVHRVLSTVGSVPPARDQHGRRAGALLGALGSTAVVDAMVVAHAVEAGGAHVLTGDVDDLTALAAPHPEVRIVSL